MRNYCAVILTERQYHTHGYTLEGKNTIFLSLGDAFHKDALWFRLGVRSGYNLIVEQRRGQCKEIVDALVKSGIAADLRGLDDSIEGVVLFDMIKERLRGWRHRVSLCNELRDLLAQRQRYRWCGAEYESLFNPTIYANAIEICGLASLGKYLNDAGLLVGEYPRYSAQDQSGIVFATAEGMEDLGQAKLYVNFATFVPPYCEVVYVGSAPGTGWLKALQDRPSVKVWSFDPRALDVEHAQVSHFTVEIHSLDDLLLLLGPYHERRYFIWDVRGDAPEEERRELINNEILELNTILSDPRFNENFCAIQIKINSSSMDMYALPKGGRLFFSGLHARTGRV